MFGRCFELFGDGMLDGFDDTRYGAANCGQLTTERGVLTDDEKLLAIRQFLCKRLLPALAVFEGELNIANLRSLGKKRYCSKMLALGSAQKGVVSLPSMRSMRMRTWAVVSASRQR